MSLFGHDRAIAAFLAARDSGAMHHAWLLVGPRGVGKARFADMAALRVLADAAGPRVDGAGLETPADHPVAHLFAAGSHPDFRRLSREINDKTDSLRRNITVDQVRRGQELFTVSPFLSAWRAMVIDSVDELQGEGANALLKTLEEPPPNCLFLLVSHAPGRLLPTIRSRCRTLTFSALDEHSMTAALAEVLPGRSAGERAQLVDRAGGSVGRAIAFADHDLGPLESEAIAILRSGDRDNSRRSKLATALALKAAGPRYAAFLEIVPGLIAREAMAVHGAHRGRALDAYARARDLVAMAPRVSLDPAATTFQLGNILASVAA
jgi:DNA polymerase III subunit delta'